MGMIAYVNILGVCNVASEMDMENIFDFCCDANQPGARVDYLPQEAFDRISFPIGHLDKNCFQNGAIVVWTGFTTNQNQLVEAVIKELEGDDVTK